MRVSAALRTFPLRNPASEAQIGESEPRSHPQLRSPHGVHVCDEGENKRNPSSGFRWRTLGMRGLCREFQNPGRVRAVMGHSKLFANQSSRPRWSWPCQRQSGAERPPCQPQSLRAGHGNAGSSPLQAEEGSRQGEQTWNCQLTLWPGDALPGQAPVRPLD
jgi:hypothetical protein